MGKANKKLAKSYITLFLVLLLSLTFSFAWFTKLNVAETSSELLQFQSASSLRINKDKSIANKITIPAFTLDEASSLDGRNIYFPLGESFNTNTAEMFFREANAGDRITGKETDPDYTNNPEKKGHYIYKDFELKGTSGNTPVYIKSYKIKVASDANGTIDTSAGSVDGVYQDELTVVDSNGDPISKDKVPDHQVLPPDNCPIRLAFIADSGVSPVVIDPSAQVVDYVDNSNKDPQNTDKGGVVSRIDENGVPTRESSYPNHNWNSFSTYYYEHTPLFVIPGGQTLKVTLVIWLEGTLPNCDAYIGKHISVDIDIESNFADMDTITFVDDTIGDTDSNVHYWIDNPDNGKEPIIACSYEDPFSNETHKRWKTVIMRKTKEKTSSSGSEWQCEIPKKAVDNIAFYRLTPHNGSAQGTIYNPWYTRSNAQSLVETAINDPDPDSKITSSWLTQGDLQSTRTFLDSSTNTYDNALVYTAIHGNGYSSTTDSRKRLSPCVGYWNYSPGSGSSTGGGGQQPGGGSSVTNCNVTVIARIPDGKSWVSSTDTLGFETDAGNSYYFTNDAWTDNGKKNELTASIPCGEKIVRFCKKNSSGNKYYPFNGGTQTWTVPSQQSSYTVTYTMTSQDYWGYN